MKKNITYEWSIIFLLSLIGLTGCKSGDKPVQEVVKVSLEKEYPVEKIKSATFDVLATIELFPEGPSYRESDGSYFYAGNDGLSRIDKDGNVHVLIRKPSGGGTHILPDGSILLIGYNGLRRVFPDGKVALLADAEKLGRGNDLTVDASGAVYWSVPNKGVYRLESGKDKMPELIVPKRGLNGLDVDPAGEFLFICRGRRIVKHKIFGPGQKPGPEELVYEFQNKDLGGADGCTFDAYGNFWLMHFRSGIISVINPKTKKLITQRFCGVKPATNLAFCGPERRDLMITAGAPRYKNCSILKMNLDLQGFPGHPGSTEYRVIKYLEEKIDPKKFQ